MAEYNSAWLQKAEAAIREVAGDAGAEQIDSDWRAHEAVASPVVTLFGSYDSGKSTLLKRLLVDGGVDVPSWLTVSARRETFEIREIDGLGCRFRDTPGIAGGNKEHEQLAQDALTTSDAILLVLPSQLVTGDRETVLAVLTGEVFRSGGLPIQDALLTAICKLDEGGVDPSDDPNGYEDYVKRKRKEWLAVLSRNGVDADEITVFAVAADPFQTVGNAPSPDKSAYDPFRGWDGIQMLLDALECLPKRLKNLRRAAHQRFLCARMEALCMAMRGRLTDVTLSLSEAQANRERFELLEGQLDALLRAARASLDGVVEQELVTAVRSRIETLDAIESFISPRLQKAVSRWWDDQTAAMNSLLAQAEAEVEARERSFGGTTAKKALGDGQRDEKHSRGGKSINLGPLFTKAQKILIQHHEEKLGMKLGKAREELKRLGEAKSFADYSREAGRRKSFRTLEEAGTARRVVGVHSLMSTLGPVVIELGGLLWDEAKKNRLEKQRAERRAKLREDIRTMAVEIAAEAWKEWSITAEQFRGWLGLHGSSARASEEVLDAEVRLLSTNLDRLNLVLKL